MDAKLTLKLDKEVIEAAKKYAADQGQSLSRMIENYLRFITDKKNTQIAEDGITPYVRSISTGVSIPADAEKSKEFLEYLAKKHS